jgi:two-component sensor histidine kinase
METSGISLLKGKMTLPTVGSGAAWAIGAAIVLGTALAKAPFDAAAGASLPPYILFYPAVVVIALLGGPRVGLAAAISTLLVAWYFFLPTYYSFAVANRPTGFTLAVYAFTSAFLAWVVGVARLAFDASIANEAQRDYVARESVHRIKNLIAVVQAISAKVSREASSFEEYRSTLSTRLSALAIAQGVLVRRDWQDVEIHELIDSALAPFLPNPGLHLEGGPAATVPAQHVNGLCMALYELCTNAMKYGALRQGKGPVNLSWRRDGDDCVLEWREQSPTGDHGESFGTQLIRSAFSRDPSTKVAYDVAEDRVQASFRWRCAG